jgi:lipoprotein-anchoring transpeptidase ErfK/SrfK
MSFVRVLIAAAAAAVFVSSAAAEAPTATATQVANTPPAAQEQPSGHHASDAALPAAVDAATPEEVGQAAPLEPPPPTLFADIDLSTQTLTVSDASGELYRWPISSARAGYRTPTGTFSVNWTSRMHYSRQYDWSPMPFAVFFNRGVAVHGTAAVGSLGRPASHGCVRLHPKNAEILFKLVRAEKMANTRVVLTGTIPGGPGVVKNNLGSDPYAADEGLAGWSRPPAPVFADEQTPPIRAEASRKPPRTTTRYYYDDNRPSGFGALFFRR